MNNIEEANNTIELLKLALQFYANEDNYKFKHNIDNKLSSIIELDSGYQANFILDKIKKQETVNKEMEENYLQFLTEDEKNNSPDEVLKIFENLKKMK